MKSTKQKLMNIVCSGVVNQYDIDFFEDNIESYRSEWSNLYLWSVELNNYQFSDMILQCGLDINNDEIRRNLITDLGFGKKKKFEKIFNDGYVIDKDLIDEVLNKYSNDVIFDKVYFNNFIISILRFNKIQKIKERIQPNKK